MTASSSEVVSVVKDILKTSSKAADILGVSEVLLFTVLRDQVELTLNKLSHRYSECDI
tara:strand:- start:342 stop:515 length:174 start_codon:yes stop_codon:yes gene_type:complete